MIGIMSDELHHQYAYKIRGNQDVFLIDIMRSPEFEAIRERHLHNVFMGIYELLKRVEGDDDSARKVHACAAEISDTFKISEDSVLRLLITPSQPFAYEYRYLPHIKRDGDEVVMRFGRKTTLADIKAVWKVVKDVQRDIGGSGGKQSINPELAFCIHRQYVLLGRKMKDIFDDYSQRKLEGYKHPPTLHFEDEFRKYYKRVVKGL